MASEAEGIILQPLWKIHNIDWSDRRNVFETDPARPSLDLLRRNTVILNCYDTTSYQHHNHQPDKFDYHYPDERDKQLTSSLCRHLWVQWTSFTVDIVRTSA